MIKPRIKKLYIFLRLLALSCVPAIGILISMWWMPATAQQAAQSHLTTPIKVELFAENVTFPVAMEFAPDGHLFVTERFVGAQVPITGTIRVISSAGLIQTTPFATIELADSTPFGEKGLLGLALDPAFTENGYLYAYRTAPPDENNPDDHGEILRYTAILSDSNWIGSDMVTLVDDLPVSFRCCHNGGVIHFGPDGKLYLSIGDNLNSAHAQDLATRAGTLLRFNPDGTIPTDNPFVDTKGADPAVYAYGLRNTFAYDWHPITGALYGTENGPNCNDELNQIVAGGNYGWPLSYQNRQCVDPGEGYIAPLLAFDPPVGLTGAAFYTGDRIPDFQNHLFIGDWNHGTLYRVDLAEDDGLTVATEFFENCGQPTAETNYSLLDITTGPDGHLYFSCQQEFFSAPPETGAIYRLVLSTVTATQTATATPMASQTATQTPTSTPTATNMVPMASQTATQTPTSTPTATNMATATATPTSTPTVTDTPPSTPAQLYLPLVMLEE